MKFELITKDSVKTLTAKQQQFLTLHNEIMLCGTQATSYIYELAKRLKQMKESKMYMQADFQSFGEYVENAVGIKERQAYTYISIIENLSEDFLQSTAKIGVSKLGLLATLSEEKRTEIIENIDLENTTVKNLQNEIDKIKKNNENLKIQIGTLQRDNEIKDTKNNEQQEVINSLRNEILKNDSSKEISDLKQQITDLNLEKKKTEEELKEIKERPQEIATIENPETKLELEKSIKTAQALEEELKTVKKKLSIAENSSLAKFKIKFEDWQKQSNELFEIVKTLDIELSRKCLTAIKTVVGEWKYE